MSQEPLVAVFIDFENLALGVKDSRNPKFDVALVLTRLLQKGRVVYKRAYCDWSNYKRYLREFHGQGIELIDIPQSKVSGKNSADIRMVVDALDLCYSKNHIDMFALLSGDSDFSPLVSKLKENNKRVVGCGVKSSTSELLIANCDEFIYYDDLVRSIPKKPRREVKASKADQKRQEAVDIVASIVTSLAADYDPVWGSQVKQTIRRVHPSFAESYYGFKSFSELLEAAEKEGRVTLDFDQARGNFKVTLDAGGQGAA